MSQIPRLSRARQLKASVWPGRVVDGYGNFNAARLRKLAAARSTGMLPFSGEREGAVCLRDGDVVYAESSGTPAGRAAPGTLTAILAGTEPTVNAALDLLSTQSRHARFRPARVPPPAAASGIPVDVLLAEITRRQQVLQQLSPVLSPDTAVCRNPRLAAPAVQVPARQWSLLIRAADGATPRALAWALHRSVFGTTTDVYRLLALDLLSVAGRPGRLGSQASGEAGARGPALLSFIRALSEEKGEGMPEDASAGPAAGSEG